MRKFCYILIIMAITLLYINPSTAVAQHQLPLRMVKAERTGVDITMLDSVVGSGYRKIYQYNEYGYITSVMEYYDGELETETSYRQEYVFNDNGQCTERTRYKVDSRGNKTTIIDKGVLEVKDGFVWEHLWETADDGMLYRDESCAYDQWGNCCEDISYSTDLHYGDGPINYIYSYKKHRYSAPVDRYVDHVNYSEFADAYTLYSIESEVYGDGVTQDVGELHVATFKKVEWSKENGKLYRRVFDMSWDSDRPLVAEVESHKRLRREDIYTLNSNGTRPLSRHTSSFTDEWSEDESDYTWEWDSKGRLISMTRKGGGESCTVVYTYTDDYARELSLVEAVLCLEYDMDVYPEERYQRFGRVATLHKETDMDDSESIIFTWNADGQLVRSTWSEHDMYEDGRTINYTYNSDGHMAYYIDQTANGFVRKMFVYDTYGKWIEEQEYYSESVDGPWRVSVGERKDAMSVSGKFTVDIDDMSEGFHGIHSNDGVWVTEGHYVVENGVIRDGQYKQYLVSTASIPDNPAYNYTDPVAPLESSDCDEVSNVIDWWHYVWNHETRKWQCKYAPQSAGRVYKEGDKIVCDIYDSSQELISSTVYSFDAQDRLILINYGNSTTAYSYLDGTDYLLETINVTSSGERRICHYYYSSHNYVPSISGIDNISADVTDGIAYDMQGRRVGSNGSRHGIFIIDGRKVVR